MMQKDIHYYATAVMAKAVGLDDGSAALIAWADQYTDDNQGEPFPTQCYKWGLWDDPRIQREILCPFHFVPGLTREHLTATAAESPIVRALVNAAILSRDRLRLGIALHGLQDSFSHQGFSGLHEELNSCYPWFDLQSIVPNVGHAEEGPRPDIASLTWTDYRTKKVIRNPERFLRALRSTAWALARFAKKEGGTSVDAFPNMSGWILGIANYEERKTAWQAMAESYGMEMKRYSAVNREMETSPYPMPERFLEAARAHRALYFELIREAIGDRKELADLLIGEGVSR